MHCLGKVLTCVLCLILASREVQGTHCGIFGENVCVPIGQCKDGYTSSIQGCLTTEVCCPPNKRRDQFIGQCGQSNLDVVNREGEFPWEVALGRNGAYKNAGSLIAPDVVLTAAHVVIGLNERDLTVRAGRWDQHMYMGIRLIVRYPNFVKSTGANNLALLFLDQPFPPSVHISPICLPPPNRRFDNNRCIVNSWNKCSSGDNSVFSIGKIEVPVVSNVLCYHLLRPKMGRSFSLPYGVICAGGEYGKDACEGAGGAPLVCPLMEDPTRYEQAGIVNWGFGCWEQNVPAVYTDVASFRGWIDGRIIQHSRNPSYQSGLQFAGGSAPGLQFGGSDLPQTGMRGYNIIHVPDRVTPNPSYQSGLQFAGGSSPAHQFGGSDLLQSGMKGYNIIHVPDRVTPNPSYQSGGSAPALQIEGSHPQGYHIIQVSKGNNAIETTTLGSGNFKMEIIRA